MTFRWCNNVFDYTSAGVIILVTISFTDLQTTFRALRLHYYLQLDFRQAFYNTTSDACFISGKHMCDTMVPCPCGAIDCIVLLLV